MEIPQYLCITSCLSIITLTENFLFFTSSQNILYPIPKHCLIYPLQKTWLCYLRNSVVHSGGSYLYISQNYLFSRLNPSTSVPDPLGGLLLKCFQFVFLSEGAPNKTNYSSLFHTVMSRKKNTIIKSSCLLATGLLIESKILLNTPCSLYIQIFLIQSHGCVWVKISQERADLTLFYSSSIPSILNSDSAFKIFRHWRQKR